ncbi:MAG: aspartate/glutamate racemase family protein [Pseudomonadota bacterium]
MHLGLIGGIGVAGTVAYYQRLTATIAAKSKPLELTIAHADVSTLIANTLGDNRNEQAAIYARLIDRLKAAGCDCAAITSLGGHFCYEETAALSALPLVSAIKPLDAYFMEKSLDTIGMLGTKVVLESRMFGQLARTRTVVPEADLSLVGQTYMDMARVNHCNDDQRAFFFEHGRQMIDSQGAKAVVLAGTDLGLAFDGFDPGYPVVDALDVHVDLLSRLVMGEVSLS